ncbi:MAG: hypothetical protein IJT87_13345 [Ruminiclostridium sp.]|nr:hypothetical protein [Ruminiclostridium sp.]
MEWIASIFNPLIDWCVNLINSFLGGLGAVINDWLNSIGLEITLPPNVYDVLNEISIGVGYLIPVKALIPIPLFFVSFYIAKLVFAIYQLIASTIIKRVKLKL